MKNQDAASAKKFNKLLKRIAADDNAALEELFTGYGKLIYAAALTVVGPHSAEEVVDDVLARVWKGAANYGNIKKPVSWLYTISVNCAKDKLRANRQTEEIFDLGTEDKGISGVIEDDSFYWYINGLDEEEQVIMVCRFVQDMTFKEIAKELNKPLNTVTSVYYRALKKIEEKIEKSAKN